MKTLRRSKLKIDPAKVYVAWQSFAVDQYVFERGTRLKGSHPAVARMAEAAFVEDGTPENEWPTHFDAVVADAEARPPKPERKLPFPASTPIGELVICTRGILASAAGACRQGVVLMRTDLRVQAVPEAFSALTDTLDLER